MKLFLTLTLIHTESYLSVKPGKVKINKNQKNISIYWQFCIIVIFKASKDLTWVSAGKLGPKMMKNLSQTNVIWEVLLYQEWKWKNQDVLWKCTFWMKCFWLKTSVSNVKGTTSTKKCFLYKGWLAIAKLKPLSLFISLLLMLKKSFDNVKIEKWKVKVDLA